MKFATALLMTIGVAAAGRLENTYLPPGSAATAGGAAFVQAPGFTGGSVSGSSHHHQGGSSSTGGSFHGHSGAYQGQSGAYRGQSASYQGQSGSYHQGQSATYQGQSGSYQGQSGSYQGQSGQRGPQYAITQYNNQNNGDGAYQYNYETENGISAQESGAVQGDSQTVSGSYSYTGPDGVVYTIHYTAGPNGFQAEGAHIPTPPPIPEEIRRGVELSLAAEARGENQDGQYRAEPQQAYNNNNNYQSSGIAVGAGQHGNKGGYRY